MAFRELPPARQERGWWINGGDGLAFSMRAPRGMEVDSGVGIDGSPAFSRPAPCLDGHPRAWCPSWK